jgi:hypothetical protein
VKAVLDSCDLVYVLAEGKVLAHGTPAEVAANQEVRERYLGTRMKFTAPSIAAEQAGLAENNGAKHAGAAAAEEATVTT